MTDTKVAGSVEEIPNTEFWDRDENVGRQDDVADNAYTISINWHSDVDPHYSKIEVYDWNKERGIELADRIVQFLNENNIQGGK